MRTFCRIYSSASSKLTAAKRGYRAGLGLGPSIARQLVEMHGGSIQAQSGGRDKGATFTITLPITPFTEPKANSESKPESRASEAGAGTTETVGREHRADNVRSDILSGLRVLAVDDQPDTRELITLAPMRYGAEMRVCTSATRRSESSRNGSPMSLCLISACAGKMATN